MGCSVLKRLKVIGIGLVIGAIFSLFVAGVMMPWAMTVGDRIVVWAGVMSGPILGTAWEMHPFHTFICLGWLGLILILAHPVYPKTATACITLVGLLLWFLVGFVEMMVAVNGA
jgi:hypothetical protein